MGRRVDRGARSAALSAGLGHSPSWCSSLPSKRSGLYISARNASADTSRSSMRRPARRTGVGRHAILGKRGDELRHRARGRGAPALRPSFFTGDRASTISRCCCRGRSPIEFGLLAIPHLAFIAWLVASDRAMRTQRAIELARFARCTGNPESRQVRSGSTVPALRGIGSRMRFRTSGAT